MSRAKAEQELQHAFVEVLAANRRRRSAHGGPELSVAQFRGLALLADSGEMTAGELAKAAELTPASVTGMVDALERSGIVERQRSTEDRRRVVVSITVAGRALVERKRAWWTSVWQDVLGDLPQAQIAGATVVLERLAAALSPEQQGEHAAAAAGAGSL